MLNKTLTMMFAVAAIVTNAAYAFTTGYHKYPTILRRLMQSEDDLFEAEEAAAFDATDIDDSGVEAAVMERAVMMAYDMMSKKKLELKEKVEDARSAEQQYYMMEEATKDLVKQYNEDVSYPYLMTMMNRNVSFIILLSSCFIVYFFSRLNSRKSTLHL